MATSKGKMLTEQITFDFFDEVKIQKTSKAKKEKVVAENKNIKENKKEEKILKQIKPIKLRHTKRRNYGNFKWKSL